MKLALICTEKLPVPPVRGGAIQAYIQGVLPYLAAHHQVTVVGRTDPALPDREERGGVRYVRIPADGGPRGRNRGGGDPDAYAAGVATFLAGERWDGVLVYNRPRFLLQYAQAAPGARFWLSLHNEMLHPDRISRADAKAALKRVTGVVAISDFIRDGVAGHYPAFGAKCRTIRSGVDLARFRPGADGGLRKELGLTGRQVILAVARLSPKKGVHLLIQAMERVAATHPDAVLLHVGSRWYGSDEPDDYVRAIGAQAAALGERVRLAGYVPYDRVHRYFGLADLFVCPSQWSEPLARVHYEAMAAGLPVITTDRGGNGEVIRHGGNGLVLREPRADLFAGAIRLLLDDPALRRRMGREGRSLAEARFGWERVARELLETLEG